MKKKRAYPKAKPGKMGGGYAMGSRGSMHSGGAMGAGPKAPSANSKAARVKKHTGGAKTNNRGSMGKPPRQGRGHVTTRKRKGMGRDEFISKAEEALGDTEF